MVGAGAVGNALVILPISRSRLPPSLLVLPSLILTVSLLSRRHHHQSMYLGASKIWGDLAKDHIGLDSLTFCTALGTCSRIQLHVPRQVLEMIRNAMHTALKQEKRKRTDN